MSVAANIRQFFASGFEIKRMVRSSSSDAPDAWDWSIEKFEAEDRRHAPAPGAIVFTGSSSITFWKTLDRDMAPLPVLNRGFGGSKMHQVVHYADRTVIPYRPRAVVLFAGTNDISGRHPRTAREVFDGYVASVQQVHADLPDVPIYYISITPTPSRWKLWPTAEEANRLIEAHTKSDPRLRFIDLTSALLTSDGKPDRSLYRIDRLHPNARGYAKWTSVIRPVLEAAVPQTV